MKYFAPPKERFTATSFSSAFHTFSQQLYQEQACSAAEPAPGHLHQGGIWISRGAQSSCVWWGFRVGSVPICDRVRAWCSLKACRRFLIALFFIGFTFAFEIDHIHKEGRGWKVGGIVTRLGGGNGPAIMPPLGRHALLCGERPPKSQAGGGEESSWIGKVLDRDSQWRQAVI